MDEPWFYCESLAEAGAEAVLSESESRHALQSRRLQAGDALTLFDGRGATARAIIGPDTGRARPKRVGELHVRIAERAAVPRPVRRLTLVTAAAKGDRLDFLVEKCTELGAARLLLTAFERSVVKASSTHVAKLNRTALEACKQCRRAWLPEIDVAGDLEAALRRCSAGAGGLLIAHPGPDSASLAGVSGSQTAGGGTEFVAVIGPEGGLSPGELELLSAAGGRRVSLGPHILRVETAAVAVAACFAATATA